MGITAAACGALCPPSRLTSSLALTVAATASAVYVIYHSRGAEGALTFIACYAMELSLSVDNMFAFYLIFQYFKCPDDLQNTALTWGIVGAIVLRAIALVAGSAAVHAVKPLMLVFAAALFWSAVQMGFFGGDEDENENVGETRIVRLVTKVFPVTTGYHGGRLFAREDGSWRSTPLFLVLVTIELTDIVFAVDSVPAVLGMSSDTLIVYLAVMCAVLSLRSIYTVTVLLIQKFVYLQPAVALLLGFIGTKITLSVLFGKELPTSMSLTIIASTLGAAIALSVCLPAEGSVVVAIKRRLGLWRESRAPFAMAVHGRSKEELRELHAVEEVELEAPETVLLNSVDSPAAQVMGCSVQGTREACSEASKGHGDGEGLVNGSGDDMAGDAACNGAGAGDAVAMRP